MILYHGSFTAVEKPDLAFSRLRTDFGKGFYLFMTQSLIDDSLRFLGSEALK